MAPADSTLLRSWETRCLARMTRGTGSEALGLPVGVISLVWGEAARCPTPAQHSRLQAGLLCEEIRGQNNVGSVGHQLCALPHSPVFKLAAVFISGVPQSPEHPPPPGSCSLQYPWFPGAPVAGRLLV